MSLFMAGLGGGGEGGGGGGRKMASQRHYYLIPLALKQLRDSYSD